jgi:hypothetical protein
MRLLNKLKAAPGQQNRGLFDGYFRSKKWINLDQTCEDWPIQFIPKEGKEMSTFLTDLAQFEAQQANPEIVP